MDDISQPPPQEEQEHVKKPLRFWARWLGYVVILLLGAWVGFWVRKTVVRTQPAPTTIQPTIPPIEPTVSNRPLSSVATQSAFLFAEQNIASLSSSIANLNLTPSELNPPVIELSLGLSEN